MITEMKKMPFLMMKRTQLCMFLRFVRVFPHFHIVKIIQITSKSLSLSHVNLMKKMQFLVVTRTQSCMFLRFVRVFQIFIS